MQNLTPKEQDTARRDNHIIHLPLIAAENRALASAYAEGPFADAMSQIIAETYREEFGLPKNNYWAKWQAANQHGEPEDYMSEVEREFYFSEGEEDTQP